LALKLNIMVMSRRDLFLISSAMASFITPFISSAVNIALPAISRSFNVDIALVNWFANIFLMSMASTILFWGVVADWIGKEKIFVAGVTLFLFTAFIIPYINNFMVLLILRFLQGLGAAMISGTAVAIIVSLHPERRGFVIGINTTAVYLGSTLGPVLGGFLIDYAGWKSIFLFTAIVSVMSIVLALSSLDFRIRVKSRRPQFQILLAIIASTILVIFGSTYIGYFYGLTTLFLGLVIFIYILYIEYRKSLNLVKQIFERKTFLAYIVALLNYVATYALAILLSNYLQLDVGFTAREAGLILLAQPITQMFLSPLAGYLADKTNPGVLVTIGMSLITLGIGISSIVYRWINLLIISLILLGMGFAFFASPNTTQIMQKIPRESFASASAFLGLMRFLGQSLSTSILTAIVLLLRISIPIQQALLIYMAIAFIGTVVAIASIT